MNAEIKRSIRKTFSFAVRLAKRTASSVRHRLSKQKSRRLLRERSDLCVEVGAGNKAGEGNWIIVDVTGIVTSSGICERASVP
jgi:predicted RNase H-related nuclease YkuK (DUF458 family)